MHTEKQVILEIFSKQDPKQAMYESLLISTLREVLTVIPDLFDKVISCLDERLPKQQLKVLLNSKVLSKFETVVLLRLLLQYPRSENLTDVNNANLIVMKLRRKTDGLFLIFNRKTPRGTYYIQLIQKESVMNTELERQIDELRLPTSRLRIIMNSESMVHLFKTNKFTAKQLSILKVLIEHFPHSAPNEVIAKNANIKSIDIVRIHIQLLRKILNKHNASNNMNNNRNRNISIINTYRGYQLDI